MQRTTLIKNVTASPVEVTIFASVNSSVRRRQMLNPDGELRVNRVTPELRALENTGAITITSVTLDVPVITTGTPEAFICDPTTDMTFVGAGFAWPSIGSEPLPISFNTNIRRFIAQDKFALLAPRAVDQNIDIDWWNCHRGPHYRFEKVHNGDFIMTVDVDADGGISKHDWAGIIAVSQINPFHYARVGIAQKPDGPIFDRVFHADKEVSDAFFKADEVGVCDEGGPYDWTVVGAGKMAVTSAISRELYENKQRARLTITRKGPLLYLIGDDFSGAERAVVIMENFLDGPVTIAFAIARYPSLGSKFQGAVFYNAKGITSK